MTDTDTDTERVWLVERTYTDKGMVEMVYATPDGERRVVRQRSANALGSVTAADEVPADRLQPVAEAATRERYRTEVERLRERHDPDDPV